MMTYISQDRMDMELELPNVSDKAKAMIKEYACMKLYDETKPLYLEPNAYGVGLGAGLLQIRDGKNCP